MTATRYAAFASLEPEEASTRQAAIPAERARQRLVARQMRAFAGPHPDLPDLIQEAWIELEMAEFRGESKYSTFAYAVCYRVWLKHLRLTSRLKRKIVQLWGEELPEVPHFQTPADDAELGERYRRLYRALARVGAVRRAVVTMHDLEGLDIAEIAEVTVTSEATVRSRLRDGRARLSEMLKKDPYFGDVACVRSR